MGGDPDRLAEVDDRIAALRALVRKHGGSLEAALSRREAMKGELSGLTGAEGRRAEVARAVAARAGEAAGLAAELGRERRRAAQAFCRAVAEELEGLAMSRCRVEVAFSRRRAASRRVGTGSALPAQRRRRSSSPPTPGSRRARSGGWRPGESSRGCFSP